MIDARKIADADVTRAVDEWVRIRMSLGFPVSPSHLDDLHEAGVLSDGIWVLATTYAWFYADMIGKAANG